MMMGTNKPIYRFQNCRILYKGRLIREDLWVRNGVILDPEVIFFTERRKADFKIDCCGSIISPGFIDLQLNGGFQVDFSSNTEDVVAGIEKVAKGILAHGVTSFCPTVITSPKHIYHKILPQVRRTPGSRKGAGVLGLHLEGPFISQAKKGAHPAECIQEFDDGFTTVMETYGNLDNVSIVTLAPELKHSCQVIRQLTDRGTVVSLGHSMGNLTDAEHAVQNGATLITHLFNAMLPFHHRDPGIVGLLSSFNLGDCKQIFYGMITDGIHTNPAAVRIAHRTNPQGIILVTDAIAAMGLTSGTYQLGQLTVTIDGMSAHLLGTKTLAGSVATMPHIVQHFKAATNCSVEEALEAATLHPAQCLKITETKGTLDYGTDADFILLDDELNVKATFVAGELVYCDPKYRLDGFPIDYFETS